MARQLRSDAINRMMAQHEEELSYQKGLNKLIISFGLFILLAIASAAFGLR
mgnify:FL=1